MIVIQRLHDARIALLYAEYDKHWFSRTTTIITNKDRLFRVGTVAIAVKHNKRNKTIRLTHDYVFKASEQKEYESVNELIPFAEKLKELLDDIQLDLDRLTIMV